MDLFTLLEYLHILGAMVLFGTGLGIAFFVFMADRSGDVAVIAGTARIVVIADFLFTASAVVLQPLTGLGMAHIAHFHLWESWIAISLGLYGCVGLFWLPVVWLQIEITKMAEAALAAGTPLPPRYRRFMRAWFFCCWPAFAAVLAILYFMVTKPEYW